MIPPYVRQVTHCPNCGQRLDEHSTGVNALDAIVSNTQPPSFHIDEVAARLDTIGWHRSSVPSRNLLVEMARYALKCRGVTGMGINKMATKIAGQVARRAWWRFPPPKKDG